MANLNPGGEKAALYLEDLRVGQRFLSGTHRIDEEQIRAFAEQFDPQPFHLDAEAAKEALFDGLVASGWHTAAVTMRLWWAADSPSPAASWAPAERSSGPGRCGRAPCSTSRAKSSS
jgi:acyl dehydratase